VACNFRRYRCSLWPIGLLLTSFLARRLACRPITAGRGQTQFVPHLTGADGARALVITADRVFTSRGLYPLPYAPPVLKALREDEVTATRDGIQWFWIVWGLGSRYHCRLCLSHCLYICRQHRRPMLLCAGKAAGTVVEAAALPLGGFCCSWSAECCWLRLRTRPKNDSDRLSGRTSFCVQIRVKPDHRYPEEAGTATGQASWQYVYRTVK